MKVDKIMYHTSIRIKINFYYFYFSKTNQSKLQKVKMRQFLDTKESLLFYSSIYNNIHLSCNCSYMKLYKSAYRESYANRILFYQNTQYMISWNNWYDYVFIL